jgi:fructoselysine-6-P-deglycase FrlB-like protein
MTTSGFRHGPQEIIEEGFRFGLWIDGCRMRDQDLALATDIRKLGGKLLVIGQDLSVEDGDLVLSLPKIEPQWQFLIDVIPAQLAGEYFSQLRGVNCDSFRICSYIVEREGGLLDGEMKGRRTLPEISSHG